MKPGWLPGSRSKFLVIERGCTMKRVSRVVVSIILICILLVGCSFPTAYDFLQDTTEITAVEIIEVKVPASHESEWTWEVLREVENIDVFLNRFGKIDCYSHNTDPLGIESDSVVILIIYADGEYEMIGPSGRATYTHERQFANYRGYSYFNYDEFQSLLMLYI
jgi:hypothetical protein